MPSIPLHPDQPTRRGLVGLPNHSVTNLPGWFISDPPTFWRWLVTPNWSPWTRATRSNRCRGYQSGASWDGQDGYAPHTSPCHADGEKLGTCSAATPSAAFGREPGALLMGFVVSLRRSMSYASFAPDPPDPSFPTDTPDGDRPTLEGSGLDGGPRLVAVLRAPGSAATVLCTCPPRRTTSRPFPQRYAGRGPSDARGVRLGR